MTTEVVASAAVSVEDPAAENPAAENPFAGQGAVLLDIGGDVGALVVSVPAEMVGVEVEIRPEGDLGASRHHEHGHGEHGHDDGSDQGGHHAHHPHVAVVNRPLPGGGFSPSLVYPSLVEGRYELSIKQTDEVRLTAEVRGGEVVTATWPV